MTKHCKIYFDFFGYGMDDTIMCTVCSKIACDIHHVHPKGMGGSKYADRIDNLIAVCRSCHNDAHASILTKEQLTYLQQLKIESHE